MGKFHGNYFETNKYRDAYIAASQKVRRLETKIEGCQTKLIFGGDQEAAMEEMETLKEELQEAKKEENRLHCLWTTGVDPDKAGKGIVWRNELGQVINNG